MLGINARCCVSCLFSACLFTDISVSQQKLCRMFLLHANIAGHRSNKAVMEMYEFLDLILYSRDCVNRLLLLGGDLNAFIGQISPQNDLVFMWYMRMGHNEEVHVMIIGQAEGLVTNHWFSLIF